MASNSFDLCRCYGVVLLALQRRPRHPEVELRRVIADEAKRLGLGTTRGRGGRRRSLSAAIKLETRHWDRRGADRADIETCCAWVDHLRCQKFLESTPTAKERTRWLVDHLRFPEALGADTDQRNETLKRILAAMEEAVPALRAPAQQYRRARGRCGRMVLAQISGKRPIDEESLQRRMRRAVPKLTVPRVDLNVLMAIEGNLGVVRPAMGQYVLDQEALDWLQAYALRAESASKEAAT